MVIVLLLDVFILSLVPSRFPLPSMFLLLSGMKGLQMFARLLQVLRRNQHAKLFEHVYMPYICDGQSHSPAWKRQGPYFPGHSIGNLKTYHLDHTLGAFVTKRFLTVQFIGLSHISPHINTYIESHYFEPQKTHAENTHLKTTQNT